MPRAAFFRNDKIWRQEPFLRKTIFPSIHRAAEINLAEVVTKKDSCLGAPGIKFLHTVKNVCKGFPALESTEIMQ